MPRAATRMLWVHSVIERVAGFARETDALLGQRAPDAEPAGFLLHQQQPQFRDLVGCLTRKTEPTGSPPISAIQQCSRAGS